MVERASNVYVHLMIIFFFVWKHLQDEQIISLHLELMRLMVDQVYIS